MVWKFLIFLAWRYTTGSKSFSYLSSVTSFKSVTFNLPYCLTFAATFNSLAAFRSQLLSWQQKATVIGYFTRHWPSAKSSTFDSFPPEWLHTKQPIQQTRWKIKYAYIKNICADMINYLTTNPTWRDAYVYVRSKSSNKTSLINF